MVLFSAACINSRLLVVRGGRGGGHSSHPTTAAIQSRCLCAECLAFLKVVVAREAPFFPGLLGLASGLPSPSQHQRGKLSCPYSHPLLSSPHRSSVLFILRLSFIPRSRLYLVSRLSLKPETAVPRGERRWSPTNIPRRALTP